VSSYNSCENRLKTTEVSPVQENPLLLVTSGCDVIYSSRELYAYGSCHTLEQVSITRTNCSTDERIFLHCVSRYED
jgi:hypothetical protein